jgi:small-conductance mechanosensitive channel
MSIGKVIRVAALRGWPFVLTTIVMLVAPQPGVGAATHAGAAAPASGSASEKEAPPPEVAALLTLLADPKVREWLERQHPGQAASKPAAPPESFSGLADSRIAAIREHFVALSGAVPEFPSQLGQAMTRLESQIPFRGSVLLLVLAFAAFGIGVEWLFRKATQKTRQRVDSLPMADVNDRLRVVAARFVFAFVTLVAFGVGCLGPFLVFGWPPLLRQLVLGYLIALLATRVAAVVGDFVLAPGDERFRVVPATPAVARFWYRRLVAFAGWFAFGWVTVELLNDLGLSVAQCQLIAYVLALGLLAIALESVWRRPAVPEEGAQQAPAGARHLLGRGAQNALLSVGIVLLWGLWVARAMIGFWFLLVAIALPLAIGVTRRATEHLLRPPGSEQATGSVPSAVVVILERGVRALLLIAAAGVLAWGWGVDLVHLAGQNTALGRFVQAVLSVVIIVLVADVVWHASKAAIDRKLAETKDPGLPNSDEAHRRARLRTLLPIFRNVLFVVVVAVAAMMALAAMGVEIGPMLAGAGVIGVAIGFGAQPLVRDVIAGVFYLLDDAFRVGEYIQSGNYKGTVESFSVRSVRLRHQRGPLFTVPFALLGAVQNMSRDWVTDKLTVGITYDSDIELARKLIKKIGAELSQDPEFAPVIIEPLKMQGVDAFGDFAVQIRMKMTTLPGQNFTIRRRALFMIKKAFDANGIKFAFPTVQIAGDQERGTAAAAKKGLELTAQAAA